MVKIFFLEDIWSMESKKINDENVFYVPSNLLSQDDKNMMLNLFRSFEKVEYMRIDGRIQDGKFYLIELSPDCFLGEGCAVQNAFNKAGYNYPQMLNKLIENALTLI